MNRLRVLGVFALLMTMGVAFGVARQRVGAAAEAELSSDILKNPIQATREAVREIRRSDRESARDERSQSSSEDFSWAGRLRAGDVIEVKGVNGGITARPVKSWWTFPTRPTQTFGSWW